MADRLVEPGGDRTAQQAIRGRCRPPAGGFEPWTLPDVEQSIARRFAHQVSRHPERIAIRTPRLSPTYTELDRRANRIAHALLALAGPGAEPVGIMFANGAWFAAADRWARRRPRSERPGPMRTRHAVAQLDDVARIPRPTRPAILFCIFTSFGYGHLSRLHRVARALLTRAPVGAYVIGCQPPGDT